jgi:hypothetical protein
MYRASEKNAKTCQPGTCIVGLLTSASVCQTWCSSDTSALAPALAADATAADTSDACPAPSALKVAVLDSQMSPTPHKIAVKAPVSTSNGLMPLL